ncbi:S8 family peptidase [Acidipropionibacterium virtanenii]|uniref:Subtilisin E n=1 Tax=Acidipropionibacterium virtanenii TaxID=2057246 RepID=A0A344UUU7_9ACTN|nr:S8 family serine peptidase [Acidipropionibacterium virtanenii]AXE39045.1 Subtilisin E [Acidipropionibacterium virtanenii]
MTAVSVATVLSMSPQPALAAPATGGDQLRRARSAGPISTSATARMAAPDAEVNVIVQMTGDPVATVEAKAGKDLPTAETDRIRTTLRTRQDSVTGRIRARGGRVVSLMQSAYNGVHVRIARGQIEALTALPGVESVHVVTPRTASDSADSSDSSATAPNTYLGVPQVWQSTGHTGRNIKVAVIDTGLDHTHADFGGPGTTAAYDTARSASAASPDPSLIGPRAARIKGGYDFAGDAYNSSGTGAALTPAPDSNPMDCIGHGTHVSGVLAGSGVTSTGKTYRGSYSVSGVAGLPVAPGVAPQADLYPLKIFGCTGTSDLTTEAIDWAVAHHMDVINMSLGGVYGRPDDPDAVAAGNAVAAGTVVIAAAGNAGQSPYLAGAPGTGRGVVPVAAVNNAASLPGYRGYAPFSSAGPAGGDSSLTSGVAAPGVLVPSAAIGTGTGAVEMSGTSSATPQVAGVAALAVQAHPGWKASRISAALVSTASTDVPGYSPVLGGGLIDPARAVSTTTAVEGDSYRVPAGRVITAGLSFGLQESTSMLGGRRSLTITNTGSRPVTYTLSSRAATNSRPATLSLGARRVTVRPHSSARIQVSLRARASTVGSSLNDATGFHEISGTVVIASGRDTLQLPYLMVPRAQTAVTASARSTPRAAAGGIRAGRPTSLTLTNRGGALAAASSVYTWGLADRSKDPTLSGGSGHDLRAAGVQTMRVGSQPVVVFAVNTWDRWSSPAADEFDVAVDTDGDGTADRIVFATDSGLVRRGAPDGTTEVFIQNTDTGAISASGFLAISPTDASTIQMPVTAADLGIGSSAGTFSYTVSGYGGNGGEDSFDSRWARYNPWSPALDAATDIGVPINRSVGVTVAASAVEIARQKPLGLMVVTPDNRSGSTQAALLPVS